MKIFSTILVFLCIASAIMVGVSDNQGFASLSANALSDNAMWYRLMHLSAVMFLMLNVKSNKYNVVIGVGMALILVFDMYYYPLVHNIITASTLVLAGFSLVSVVKGFDRNQMIALVVIAFGIFALGYFNKTVHHLLAEIIAMVSIMNGKLIEIYKHGKSGRIL